MKKSHITAVTLHITYDIRIATIERNDDPANDRYYTGISRASADRLQRVLLDDSSGMFLNDLDLPVAMFARE